MVSTEVFPSALSSSHFSQVEVGSLWAALTSGISIFGVATEELLDSVEISCNMRY